MSVTAALLLALQGVGAPGTLTFDVRCMIVLGQLSQSDDPTMRAAASTASQYYFGRIDGRVADAELEAAIWRETRGMREEEQAPLVQACAAHMQARGERLVEVGNRISARDAPPARR
jgi:hypothetical protein